MNLIEASGLTFRYFEKSSHMVLEKASLTIQKGSITVMIGGSGCGKSTLACVLAGLYPENGGQLVEGSVLLEGEEISHLLPSLRCSRLAMMFQNPDLQFCMDTLRSEMIFCLENRLVPKEEMEGQILSFLKRFPVEELLDRPLSGLSGGEKQMAALCCLLLLQPDGILLDEPFANLDEKAARRLITLLKKEQETRRLTIVAIDHQLDVWLPVADEIIVLGRGGQILRRGIRPENLEDFRSLFEKEGLKYPSALKINRRVLKDNRADKPEICLELSHLEIRAGKNGRILFEDAAASFPEKAVTAVLGASGSGKTTLFYAMLKQHSFKGDIRLFGKPIASIKEKDLFGTMGIVFQNPSQQFVTVRVLDEVKEGIKIWHQDWSQERIENEASALLDDYGLLSFQNYSPYMLSQGQQRRLAVLSMLSGGQRVLLLDEPTYGQDYRSTRAIMEQIQNQVKARGLTVVFITHDRQLAYEYADVIYELEEGRLNRSDAKSESIC